MGKRKYIDLKDIQLLNLIRHSPYLSVIELGERIDLSAGPTHTRLARLKELGFLKKNYIIDYSKFGLKEKLCVFELKQNEESNATFNPKRMFNSIINRLNKARFILIESIDLYLDDDNKYWVMIHFYPAINETYEYNADGSQKDTLFELDLFDMIGRYMNFREKILHREQKERVTALLSSIHRIKDKPRN